VLVCEELGLDVPCPMEVRSVSLVGGLQITTVGGWTDGAKSAIPAPSDPQRIAVTGQWHSEHAGDDLRPMLKDLLSLRDKSTNVGRRPLVYFRWAHLTMGPAYLSQCDVTFEHGVWPSGDQPIRAFTATIEVTKARDRELPSSKRFERETRHITLAKGETLENVAWREYQDPDLGELLRRKNARVIDLAGEKAGDVIALPDPGSTEVLEFTPDLRSPALLGDVAGFLQRVAESRFGRRSLSLAEHEEELGLR
jgi:hypothetical protein